MPPIKKADWSENVGKSKTAGVVDMTLLSKVNNEAIMENLKKRFENREIYTYIGHVLISLNPFRDLGIYTEELLKTYVGKNRIEMPPHVFAVAESAYYKMNAYKEHQCVIISGESGAGKTEAAKRIMQYIATVSSGESSQIQEIKDMVLATNPLLESFGCAKTLRNNNSSRHGKYLEIEFNSRGEPVGAVITNYLLEKGRVVHQIDNERNFHIFYQFCKGASPQHKETFGLQGPETYLYTCASRCLDVAGIDDLADYAATLNAMNVIGLKQEEQDNIHRILALILWLGNIQFADNANGAAQIVDRDVLSWAAYLLEVEESAMQSATTIKLIEMFRGGQRASVIESPLNSAQAGAVRDALAKALYERLFEWIVCRINDALRERAAAAHVIGVLDIYGFEIFEKNSFEQLCINYVNEKLQQIFIELTLKAEQEEYVREKIQWTPIEFFNNKIVCDLIEGKRPPGIFAALNDACATAHADPIAADNSFVQRLGMCEQNPHFEKRGPERFLVKHYAGDVQYNVSGMTDKNKDQLVRELLDLVSSSPNSFVRTLFPEGPSGESESKKRPPTAGDRIRNSAGELVAKLMQAQPSYIRCIKPNESKSPQDFDASRVLHQVKYLGLCENVRVRRAGFAYRQLFEKFVERFYLLSPKTSYAGEYTWKGDARSASEVIFKDLGIAGEEWQMGVTKAFIRHPETLFALESLRDRYWHNMAIRIQRAWRNFLSYRNECAIRIQRCYRSNRDQMKYVQIRDHGHAVLGGRKERRRFSLVSMRRFMGDYLDIGRASPGSESQLIKTACGFNSTTEPVIFSSRVQLLVPRPMRSSKLNPRVMVVTRLAVYLVVLSVEKRRVDMKLESKIALVSIPKISLSPFSDSWVFLHVDGENQDAVLTCPFKTELVTLLLMNTENRIQLDVAERISYTKQNKKSETIKFVRSDSAADAYKKHTVTVGPGMPANSVSNPPCKTKKKAARPVTSGKLVRPGGPGGNRAPDQKPRAAPKAEDRPLPVPNARSAAASVAVPLPARRALPAEPKPELQPEPEPEPEPPAEPVYQAIHAFRPDGEGEIGFDKDEVVKILEKSDSGWWLAEKGGVQGWVPSNYLQERPLSPPKPAVRRSVQQPPSTSMPNISAIGREAAQGAVPAQPNAGAPSSAAGTQEPGGVPSWKANAQAVPGIMPSAAGSGGVPAWKAEIAARKAAKSTENVAKAAASPVPPLRSAVPHSSSTPVLSKLGPASSSSTSGPTSSEPLASALPARGRGAPPPIAPKPVIPRKPENLSAGKTPGVPARTAAAGPVPPPRHNDASSAPNPQASLAEMIKKTRQPDEAEEDDDEEWH